ncbi:unnamed protein product (macronuclear) [Paramecium tetraurelia]|uniref:U2A'/phosphoprotein 32 family A C-terminal domain-containing protein n=1 Tax=Paramecium tetraurelia TaxID=5888 RepID=A0DNM1_PARTE|nr:uncharacterized protein GSPATT00018834001 [Paramecium tetraurelia]CAK84638.1 unnamed protein product [Paramecium tetraurelia]|eukprot:XP_001452035.1 hypothetical protein (macronuclear) [Paramecium tetraurelia strain d4-2]
MKYDKNNHQNSDVRPNPNKSKYLGMNTASIDINKYRDLKQTQDFNLQGNLNLQIIKTISNTFEINTIFDLDLSNQKIEKIDCLAECIQLVQLNLHNNSISDISPLNTLKYLSILNISNNQIAKLDLVGLNSLQNLEAQGNLIQSVEAIKDLDSIETFTILYLQLPSGELKNPICDINNYRNQIFKAIKSLSRLDGYTREQQCLHSEVQYIEEINIKIEIQNKTDPWYAQQIPKVQKPTSVQLDDQELKQSVEETKRSLSNLEKKLALLK